MGAPSRKAMQEVSDELAEAMLAEAGSDVESADLENLLSRVESEIDAAEHRRMGLLTPPFRSWGGEVEPMEAYRRRARRDVPYPAVFSQSGCVHLYRAWDRYALHTLGLTDAILARTEMPVDRPAHKLGLIPLAHDLEAILRRVRANPSRGLYRAAVEDGEAPGWIAANLDTIETIERKIYNRHDWGENLRLALTFPGKIRP